jgi:hypothetical protein
MAFYKHIAGNVDTDEEITYQGICKIGDVEFKSKIRDLDNCKQYNVNLGDSDWLGQDFAMTEDIVVKILFLSKTSGTLLKEEDFLINLLKDNYLRNITVELKEKPGSF